MPQIKTALRKSKAVKIFIVNIANKPFETNNFTVSDYLMTVKRHLGADMFAKILVNVNQIPKIPSQLRYKYVRIDKENLTPYKKIIKQGDFVSNKYPIYHDSEKVGNLISKLTG